MCSHRNPNPWVVRHRKRTLRRGQVESVNSDNPAISLYCGGSGIVSVRSISGGGKMFYVHGREDIKTGRVRCPVEHIGFRRESGANVRKLIFNGPGDRVRIWAVGRWGWGMGEDGDRFNLLVLPRNFITRVCVHPGGARDTELAQSLLTASYYY